MKTPSCQNESKEQKPSQMIAWLAKHEIAIFFTLTLAFSWVIYLCLAILQVDNPTTLSRWCLIAAFGPSLAALFLARIKDSRRDKPRIVGQTAMFLLVFTVAAFIEWLDHRIWSHRIDISTIIADLILVCLASLVIANVKSPRYSVKQLLQGLTRWRIGIGWLLCALGMWPVLVLVANMLAHSLGMVNPAPPSYPTRIPLLLLVLESFIWFFLFGGPLNEEPGWRGFALNGLQRCYSPLLASIIVGAIWGLWHVPLHLMGLYPMGAAGAIIRILEIPRAIVFTWLFNRTAKSLWSVLLLHAAMNTTSLFFSRNYITSSALLLLLSIVLVCIDKMWQSPTRTIEQLGQDQKPSGQKTKG